MSKDLSDKQKLGLLQLGSYVLIRHHYHRKQKSHMSGEITEISSICHTQGTILDVKYSRLDGRTVILDDGNTINFKDILQIKVLMKA